MKGIELLFLFSESEPTLALADISARLNLPRSSAYRFVSTLKKVGLLAQDSESRRYRLGSRLLALRGAVIKPKDLRELTLPFLRDLMEQSGETAHLTELRDSLAFISEVVESPELLRMVPKRGQSLQLHAQPAR